MAATLLQAVDLGTDEHTDTGNADRLIAQHGDKLRYVPSWGWLVYDGKRWQTDEAGQIMELAKDTVREMRREAAEMDDKRDANTLWEHARRSQSRQRLEAMVALAKSDPAVRASVDDFDTDPWLLNVQNGTLDLRTGQLHPHDARDLITRLSPVNYDPEASSELWANFLNDIMCGNAELLDYLQRAAGYSLTGNTGEKAWYFCYGPGGNNGKSTFLEALLYIMGDYAKTVRPETLMVSGGSAIPNDLAELAGVRYGVANEPDPGQKLNMGRLKQLTGNDTMKARFLNKEFFDFKPQLKLWFAANDKPEVSDSGPAAFRRVKLIPFDQHITEPDKDMGRKLQSEASAILAWAVEGCMQWQRIGLCEPDVIRQGAQTYRADKDSFVLFLQEKCKDAPGKWETAEAVYAAYNLWRRADPSEFDSLSRMALYRKLESHGFKKERSNGQTVIRDIALKKPEAAYAYATRAREEGETF